MVVGRDKRKGEKKINRKEEGKEESRIKVCIFEIKNLKYNGKYVKLMD